MQDMSFSQSAESADAESVREFQNLSTNLVIVSALAYISTKIARFGGPKHGFFCAFCASALCPCNVSTSGTRGAETFLHLFLRFDAFRHKCRNLSALVLHFGRW
jgi:hypothetical protein